MPNLFDTPTTPEPVPASKLNGAGQVPPQLLAEEGGGEPAFDLSRYAYTPIGGGGVKREQLTIPEGRPKDVFFRVDPRPEMQMPVAIFEHKPAGRLSPDIYILTPDVAEQLGRRAKYAVIRVCICRPNVLQLWAVKVPQAERGRPNPFTETAWEACALLERQWGRLDMNESTTGYDVIPAETQWPDPEWRNDPLASLVAKAFKGRFVDSMDHDVIKMLRGTD
jgi:hypothetical protein